MITWPDPVKDVVLSSGAVQKSNIWTRGTYNAGMMALYRTNHDSCLLEHTAEWGEKHNWGLKRGVTIRNTNEYLTGQTCIELFRWIQQNKNA